MTAVRGRVIARAYTDTRALDIDCPTCGSPAGQYCTCENELGARCWRKIPCLARMTPPSIQISDDGDPIPTIDFSEPRHQ